MTQIENDIFLLKKNTVLIRGLKTIDEHNQLPIKLSKALMYLKV